ncbi:hypothetical protein LWI29_030446 [Acer saccharum]|uniref:Uncharacterized protein n=1 Tax=Acer saccharum TaxID=4024 RepID=A0AA39VWF4_ACESA|nr:hypothetical protein LWI29_030446 [Acer saccharum]
MITLGSPCKRHEVLTRTRCPDSQARKSWLGQKVRITKQEVMARIGKVRIVMHWRLSRGMSALDSELATLLVGPGIWGKLRGSNCNSPEKVKSAATSPQKQRRFAPARVTLDVRSSSSLSQPDPFTRGSTRPVYPWIDPTRPGSDPDLLRPFLATFRPIFRQFSAQNCSPHPGGPIAPIFGIPCKHFPCHPSLQNSMDVQACKLGSTAFCPQSRRSKLAGRLRVHATASFPQSRRSKLASNFQK